MEDQNLHCRHIMLLVFFFTSNKAKMRLKRAIKCVLCTKKDAVSIWMIPTEIDTDKIWVLVDENQKKNDMTNFIRFITKSWRISYRKSIVNIIRKAVVLVGYALSIFSNIFPSFTQIKNPLKFIPKKNDMTYFIRFITRSWRIS